MKTYTNCVNLEHFTFFIKGTAQISYARSETEQQRSAINICAKKDLEQLIGLSVSLSTRHTVLTLEYLTHDCSKVQTNQGCLVDLLTFGR